MVPEYMNVVGKQSRGDHLPFVSGQLLTVPGECHFSFFSNLKYRVICYSMFRHKAASEFEHMPVKGLASLC
jgi:hypothetical protein